MASQYCHNFSSELVGLLPLHQGEHLLLLGSVLLQLLLPFVQLLPPFVQHLLGSILPLASLAALLPLAVLLVKHLLATLLVDVVGGVDDVGQGLAGVLLLAVAEPQSTLAADLQ